MLASPRPSAGGANTPLASRRTLPTVIARSVATKQSPTVLDRETCNEGLAMTNREVTP